MIRFEILLPLFYNDGRPIEPEKFLATDDEIVQAFGATSTDQVFSNKASSRAFNVLTSSLAFCWYERPQRSAIALLPPFDK